MVTPEREAYSETLIRWPVTLVVKRESRESSIFIQKCTSHPALVEQTNTFLAASSCKAVIRERESSWGLVFVSDPRIIPCQHSTGILKQGTSLIDRT